MIDLRKINLQFLIDHTGQEFYFTSNITGESTRFEMDEGMIDHFAIFPDAICNLTPNF